MQEDLILIVITSALKLALILSIVPLAVIFVSGMLISIIQSITQIQEAVIAFVPKFISLVLVFYFCGGWMINELVAFSKSLFLIISNI